VKRERRERSRTGGPGPISGINLTLLIKNMRPELLANSETGKEERGGLGPYPALISHKR